MKSNNLYAWLFLCPELLVSCTEKQHTTAEVRKPMTILVQPYRDIDPESVAFVTHEIKKVYPAVQVLEAIELPENAYYQERNRYRADSIIKFLQQKTQAGYVTVALTSKDISVNKGKVKDFGVMGLGYRPGRACVASKFRLDKKNSDEQLFKVAIHELGHTQGLKHCPEKTCFMRDAEGKNPTNEEKDFCKQCKTFLLSKNWKFNSI